MRWCAVGLSLGLVACRSTSVFPCSSDLECEGGDQMGVCVEEGYCAFPDGDCPSGLRFGEFAAPELAGECVDPFGSTGEMPTTSASTTAMPTSAPPGTSSTGSEASVSATSVDASSSGEPACPTDWWDCAWSHRRAIELSFGDESLTDFPVHVRLDADRIDFETAAPAGEDVRFVAGNEVLAYERVAWQPGSAELWVRLPSLGAGGPIHLYWGNPAASDASNTASVWSNGYLAVLHMLDERDSVGLLDLASSGTVEPAPGLNGSGLQFDGMSGYLQDQGTPIDLFAEGATISVVFEASGWGESGFGRLVDAADINTTATGWSLSVAMDGDGGFEAIRFGRGYTVNRGTWYTPNSSIALDTWVVAAMSYHDFDVPMPTLWLAGEPQMPVVAELPGGVAVPSTVPVTIGALATLDLRFFAGIIDEVHFAAPRSDAWIAAEHLSFTDQLLGFGPIESH